MMTDLRFALRQLVKSPAFTLLAVITLALGIGLNTAIFSLINDLFLRGLPFKDPDRVIQLLVDAKDRRLPEIPISAPRFMHDRDGQQLFDGFAAENFTPFTLTGIGDPVLLNGGKVTPNYFDILGVQPMMGRNFLPNEEEGADVALITENFWRKRLGGDPNVIGRSITLDGVAHTIVGVLRNQPAAWFGAQPPAEVWTTKPFVIAGFSHERMMRGTAFLRVVGRLKPGMTLGQVRAALPAMAQSYRSAFPEKIDSAGELIAKPIQETITGDLRPGFATLFAAVGFVLLIACSNVANLLLVRFSGRRREIALRIALGASRTSVVRLFIFESLLVSVIAGLIGAFLAWRLVPLVPHLAANFLPLEPDYAGSSLSLNVLGFTIGLSIVTGLIMGVYPALQSSRADLIDGLKEGGRGTAGSVKQQRFRKILVGAQVALSVTLLAGAALLITSFIKLSSKNLGFQPENIWVGFVTMPTAQYPDQPSRTRFADQAMAALRGIPGFESVSLSSGIPLGGAGGTLYGRADRELLPVDKRATAPSSDIMPGYLKTFGIPLISGRDFDEHDIADRQNVVLISASGAKRVFPNENPIGKTLLVTSLATPVEIIGIVGDVRPRRVADANDMEFYRPLSPENFPFLSIAVRSKMGPEQIRRQVQTALTTVDPRIAVALPQTMAEVVAQAFGQQRLMMILLAIFAGVALLLATVGIYGAVAYSVEQRTGEIGVRMALGAQTMDILRLIVRQGMKPVVVGLIVGVAAALAVGRLIRSQLFQTSAYNPILLTLTLTILAIASLLACLFPARRATLVNPIEALRFE